MMSRREYIEMHGLEWDIEHSPCGDCKWINNCYKDIFGCTQDTVDGGEE